MPTLFDRAIQRAAQPIDPTPEPSPLRGQDTPLATSFIEGAKATNLVVTAVKVLQKDKAEQTEADPNWLPGTFLQEAPELQWFLDAAAEDEDLFDAAHSTQNETELRQVVGDYQTRLEQMQETFDNPVSGVAGMAAGAIFDVTSLIPGLGVVKGARATLVAADRARRVAALRLGAFGAVEQGAFTRLEAELDPSVGAGELAFNTGIGTVLGAAIGSAIPAAALVRKYDPGTLESLQRAGKAQPGVLDRAAPKAPTPEPTATVRPQSVGAAATDEVGAAGLDLPDPTRTGSLGRRFFGAEFFRSIKQRQLNMLADNPQDPAVQEWAGLMGKMMRWAVPTVGEEAGLTSRANTVEEIIYGRYHGTAYKGAFDAGLRGIFRGLQQDLGDGFMRYGLNESIPALQGNFLKKTFKPGVNRAEFDRMSLMVARRRAAGQDEGAAAEAVIAQTLGERIDLPATNRLAKALNEATDLETGLYRRIGEDVKAAGLDPDDLVDLNGVYRPQTYFVDMIVAAEDEFVDLLTYNMGWNPPDEFVAEFFGEGKRWVDLTPTEQDEVRAVWVETKADKLADRAEQRFAQAMAKMGAKKGEAEAAALRRFEREVVTLRERQVAAQRRYENAKTTAGTMRFARELATLETELRVAETALGQAKALLRTSDGLKTLLRSARKAGQRAEQKAARSATKALGKAEKQAGKAEAATKKPFTDEADLEKLARKMARSIQSSLSKRDSAFGFMMGGVEDTGVTGRLHPRNINWDRSILEGDPRLEKFLDMDREQLLNSYINQVAPRIAFKEVFGVEDLDEIFTEAAGALPGALRTDALADINAIQDKLLGRNLLNADPSIRFISRFLKNANIPIFLGSAGLSLPGDVMLTHLAAEVPGVTRTMRNLMKTLKPGRSTTSFQDWANKFDRNTLMSMVVGPRAVADMSSRQAALAALQADPTLRGLGRPGSRTWLMTKELGRYGEMGANAMMRVNGMNLWNVRQDMALRMTVMAHLWAEGKKGLSGMQPGFAARLRSAGITETKLERLVAEYSAKNVTYEGVILPDVDNWSKAAMEDMSRVIDTFSANGIIAPGLGEMPRFANDALGSLMFQFQGFGYAAQAKLVRNVQAKGVGDPIVLQGLLFMMLMTGISDMARETVNGRGPEYAESWSTPEGATQRVFNMFTRSPLAVSSVNTMAELMVNVAGRPGNQALKRIGLPAMIPQNSRLREREWFSILGGPGVATVNNLGAAAVSGLAAAADPESNFESFAANAQRVMPFGSHVLYRALNSNLED